MIIIMIIKIMFWLNSLMMIIMVIYKLLINLNILTLPWCVFPVYTVDSKRMFTKSF